MTSSAVVAGEEAGQRQVEGSDAAEGLAPELMSFEEWKKKQMETSSNHDKVDVEDPPPDLTDSARLEMSDDGSRPALDKHQAADPRAETNTTSGKSPSSSSTPKASSSPHRYNYASPDCSARIHSSSSLTQHASSILHKSKDRYMLTPCSAKEHWVVIELCDDIRIEAVEVGMFEFYSGVVREVVLSVGGEDNDGSDDDGDQLDGTEDSDDPDSTQSRPSHKGWQNVGQFIGRNVRGTQTFTLSNPTSFHRLLRIDFPSHYGNEYYCPISSVKVWGMNQMEAFRWEQRRTARGKEDDERGKRQVQAVVEEGVKMKAAEPAVSLTKVSLAQNASLPESSTLSPSITTPAVHTSTFTATSSEQEIPSPTASISTATGVPPTSASTALKTEAALPMSQADSSFLRHSFSATPSTSTPSAPSETTSAPAATVDTQSSQTYTPSSSSSSAITSVKFSSVTSEMRSSNTPTSSATSLSASTTSRSPLPTARTDSSESIYAFIIRRLNDLEGNTTLTAMYVEEQFKATRALLDRMQKNLEARQNELAGELKREKEEERTAMEKRHSALVLKLEKQVAIVERDRQLMNRQLQALADQVTYEKRRGIVQLVLTLSLVVFGAILLSRNLEATLIPLPQPARNKTWFKEKRFPVVLPDKTNPPPPAEHILSPDGGVALLPKIRTASSAKARKPATPANGKIRYRPEHPGASRLAADYVTPRAVTSGSPFTNRSVGFLASGNGVGPPIRRLAKSAHLHTLETKGVRHRTKDEAQRLEEQTPRQSTARTLPENPDQDPGGGTLPPNFSPDLRTPWSADGASSGYEDETGASASEVESEAGDNRRPTPILSAKEQR